MGRISTSSCRVGELDPETLRWVGAYFTARARGLALEARGLQAWERFYAACDPLVRGLARRRCGNTSDIDDCVQEVWLAVAADFLQYDPRRGPFEHWLTVLTGHVLARYHRSPHPVRHLDEESEQRLVSRESDPTIVCDRLQDQYSIQRALGKLGSTISKTSFRILCDHWIEGKTFAETGENLHLTPRQVRDRHRRAMARSRQLLSQRR